MFHRSLHSPANKKLAYQLALGNRTTITCDMRYPERKRNYLRQIITPVRRTSEHEAYQLGKGNLEISMDS